MSIVVCVELSERVKSELDELLVRGRYKDYSDAVAVAVSNQLVLQKRASEAGAFVVSVKDRSNSPQQEISSQIFATAPSVQKSLGAIPAAFGRDAAQNCQIEPAPMPNDVFPKGSKVTVDRWFFGQHNKLLPAKTSCRALAVLMAERPLGIPVAEAGPRIAKEVASVGDYLRQLDARSGASREEALATAFPTNADDSDRSRLRYANQFIGNLNTQDQLSGLLVDLKLINFLRGKEAMLLLTAPGVEFAKLTNPVLDEPLRPNGAPRPRFSEEEIQFLATHIRNHVPVEDFAFRTVLTALKNGINTPELLDQRLNQLLPSGKKKVSEAFIATQRSGVISRMSDLDMVLRRRDGIRVKYEATPRGITYLQ
jgi:Arc/MetJ-type ribon-helix-helix transcriptional regulator